MNTYTLTRTTKVWSDFHGTVSTLSRLEHLTRATRHEQVVTQWLAGADVAAEIGGDES